MRGMVLDKYSTHLPLLLKVVCATSGPVLELGVGAGSTPALHRLCEKTGRKLVSYDTDEKYVKEYAKRFENSFHSFHLVGRDEWDSADIEKPWSVVLVDHRPARRRYVETLRLAPFAQYIVAHDTEIQINRFYRWDRAFRSMKFRYDDGGVPQTTVVSNFNPLGWLGNNEHATT